MKEGENEVYVPAEGHGEKMHYTKLNQLKDQGKLKVPKIQFSTVQQVPIPSQALNNRRKIFEEYQKNPDCEINQDRKQIFS